jgi:FdhE protein
MGTRATLAPPWDGPRRRAAGLRERHPHATELLALYQALTLAWDEIAERAAEVRPGRAGLAAHVAAQAMPLVVETTLSAGPQPLREAVVRRFQEGDPAALVARWLAGEALPAADRYLARAATAPILEALPELAGPPGATRAEENRCPACGGEPQLSFFGASDEALVTAPRRLLCARCSATWAFPRMVCAGCGNQESSTLPIFADPDRFPALRVDACEVCSQYLVTVEMAKDPAAVPPVDELVALPLDLYARERGFRKVTPNLMGF